MDRLERLEKDIKDMQELMTELSQEVKDLNREVKETILYTLARDEESKPKTNSDV